MTLNVLSGPISSTRPCIGYRLAQWLWQWTFMWIDPGSIPGDIFLSGRASGQNSSSASKKVGTSYRGFISPQNGGVHGTLLTIFHLQTVSATLMCSCRADSFRHGSCCTVIADCNLRCGYIVSLLHSSLVDAPCTEIVSECRLLPVRLL